MKTKPKYRIVRVSGYTGIFNVQKKTLFGWKRVVHAECMGYCEKYIENAMNPIVKEY